MFGTVIVLCGSMYFLADPASEWIERAPKTMQQVERKLKRVVRPLASIQATASKVEEATTPDDATVTTPRRWSSRSRA